MWKQLGAHVAFSPSIIKTKNTSTAQLVVMRTLHGAQLPATMILTANLEIATLEVSARGYMCVHTYKSCICTCTRMHLRVHTHKSCICACTSTNHASVRAHVQIMHLRVHTYKSCICACTRTNHASARAHAQIMHLRVHTYKSCICACTRTNHAFARAHAKTHSMVIRPVNRLENCWTDQHQHDWAGRHEQGWSSCRESLQLKLEK